MAVSKAASLNAEKRNETKDLCLGIALKGAHLPYLERNPSFLQANFCMDLDYRP